MDLIQKCLKMRPQMPLTVAFSWFQSIALSLQDIQASQEQFMFLGRCIAQTLQTLDRDIRSGTLSVASTTKALSDLSTLLKDFAGFCQREASQSFFKSLVSKVRRLSNLDKYQKRLEIVVKAFQSSNLSDPRIWEASVINARTVDQTKLHNRLVQLEGNRQLLEEALDISRESPRAMVAAIQRQLISGKIDEEEVHFYSRCLQHLSVAVGDDFEFDPWTITPYEVEFGAVIGSGMLGQVFRGRLEDNSVAVKVMKNELKISPVTSITRRQIDDWLKLDHLNILRVMGANILDDTPFLVTPFISGGNINDYIDGHPSCDPLKYLHQASLGLAYLHTQGIIHGNVKGSNILIGDNDTAILCDYGLANLKADANSRALSSAERTLVSPSWAAPELFMGASLNKACDIYSFGMTIYEVLAQEVPLGHVPPSGLRELVVSFHGRPPRPLPEDAPQMTNDVWRLTQRCWHKTPIRRPTACAVAERLTYILSSPPHSQMGIPVRSASVDGSDPTPGLSTFRTLALNTASTILENAIEFGEDIFDNMIPNPLQFFQSSPTHLRKAHQQFMKKPYERCLTLIHHKPITTLSLSSTGQFLLLGSTVGDIDLWDATKGTTEGQRRRCQIPSSGRITCLKISSSSTAHIYAASQTGELCDWYWDGSRYISNQYQPNGGLSVRAISVHWSELRAAFMQLDRLGQMRICTWRSGSKGGYDTRDLAGMKLSSTCCTFSPTGSHLFVGDEVGTLSVWVSDTGQPSRRPLEYAPTPTNGQRELLNPSAEGPKCISIVPSPSGTDVLVGYSNGEIRLWNIASGHYTVIRIPPRQSTASAYNSMPLTLSSDGMLVLFPSFEEGRRIEVYDVKTGHRFLTCHLQDWPEDATVKHIILSPDKSRLILSFDGSTTVLIFCWPVGRWYSQIYLICFQVALSMVMLACLYYVPRSILNSIITQILNWAFELLLGGLIFYYLF